MKTIIYIFAAFVALSTVVSCGCKTTCFNSNDSTEVDSTKQDSVVKDSLNKDSLNNNL